jgi:hypothetical protein
MSKVISPLSTSLRQSLNEDIWQCGTALGGVLFAISLPVQLVSLLGEAMIWPFKFLLAKVIFEVQFKQEVETDAEGHSYAGKHQLQNGSTVKEGHFYAGEHQLRYKIINGNTATEDQASMGNKLVILFAGSDRPVSDYYNDDMQNALAKANISSMLVDMPGAGMNKEALKGSIVSPHPLVDAGQAAIRKALELGYKEIFIYAHSLGVAISACSALKVKEELPNDVKINLFLDRGFTSASEVARAKFPSSPKHPWKYRLKNTILSHIAGFAVSATGWEMNTSLAVEQILGDEQYKVTILNSDANYDYAIGEADLVSAFEANSNVTSYCVSKFDHLTPITDLILGENSLFENSLFENWLKGDSHTRCAHSL